jgi:hypothetical protein
MLAAASLLTAIAALFGPAELGLVLAASLAARSALDIPIPALMLELGALYLPFSQDPVSAAPKPTTGAVPDTSPP